MTNEQCKAVIHLPERDAFRRIGQMEQENDLIYFGRRAFEERHAAISSVHPEVRNRHFELASAYEFRLHLLREQAALKAARALTAEKVPARKVIQRVRPIATPQPQVMIISAQTHSRTSR